MRRTTKLILIPIALLSLLSCDRFLTIEDPENRTVSQGYFNSSLRIEQAVIGIYVDLRRALVADRAWLAYGELRVGDIMVKEDFNDLIISQKLKSDNKKMVRFSDWKYFYDALDNANRALEIIENAKEKVLSAYEYGLYKGEALALKSLTYFYLCRIWGNIISVEKDNFGKVINREEAINLSILFAEQAEELLPWVLLNPDGIESPELTKYRMNKCAVKIFLAEMYLWLARNSEAYDLLHGLEEDILKNRWESFGLSPGSDMREELPANLFDPEIVAISIEKLDEIYPLADTRRRLFDISRKEGTARLLDLCQNPSKLITVESFYLFLCEAAWKTERLPEAKTLLVQVAEGATENYLDIEKDRFKQALLNERRRLLIGSGVRFFDLIRFDEVASQLAGFTRQDIDNGAIYWPLSPESLAGNDLSQPAYWAD